MRCMKDRNIAPRSEEVLNRLIKYIKPKRTMAWGDNGMILSIPGQYMNDIESIDKSFLGVTDKINVYESVRTFVTPSISNYVNYIFAKDNYLDIPDMDWDLILIDGHSKKECLEKARDVISHDGVAIVTGKSLSDDDWKYKTKITDELYAYHNLGIVEQWILKIKNELDNYVE